MKTPLFEDTYAQVLKAWQDANIAQEHIDAILPLLVRNEYVHVVPNEGRECWSRFGGTPWLEENIPDDFVFLLQIALDELPEGNTKGKLPASGYLYFFVHKRGRDKAIVMHRENAPETGETNGTPALLEQRVELIFPEYESDEFDALDMPADVGNAYMDWEEEYMGDLFTRYAEGCRLLGGWTDETLAIKKTLSSKQRDQLDVLLTIDPHESKEVKQSALRQIPILAQRLYYFIDPQQLQEGNFQDPICRYDKPPK